MSEFPPVTITREVQEKLGAAFGESELDFLPRATNGGQALAVPYVDARAVMNRLDSAVGPGGWSWDFELLSADGKMVKGRLTVLGVTRCDAGESDAEAEPLKSAVSDALKRCAVHFGVARYLNYLPGVWVPYDPQKRRFLEYPRLDPAAVRKALAICGITAPVPEPESRGDQAAQAGTPVGAAQARDHLSPQAREQVTTAGALVCTEPGCGAVLTKGQHDVSMRAYGQPLCPTHQKGRAKTGGANPNSGRRTRPEDRPV